ncbi:hypothetical protein [Aquimarina spinulae]|uniref:hypothetical protein n=1 Tax=Aquimarina spinulae TaxID=1192023 RepID=UPI000D5522AC|nr:hypothetical protein [Aquimarina spinulae]
MPQLSKADKKIIDEFIKLNTSQNNADFINLNEESLEVMYKKKISEDFTFLLVRWKTKNGTKTWGLLPFNVMINDINEEELLRIKEPERYLRVINLLCGKYLCENEPENISLIDESFEIENFRMKLFNNFEDIRIEFDQKYVHNGLEVMKGTSSVLTYLKTCDIEINSPIQVYTNTSKKIKLSVASCTIKKKRKKYKLCQENLLFIEQNNTGHFLKLYQMALNRQPVFSKYPLHYFIGSKLGPIFIGNKEYDHLHLY